MNHRVPVEAVSFDAAGTLFFPNPSVGEIYASVMAERGLLLDASSLERAFKAAFARERKDPSIPDREMREYAYWKRIVRASISDLTPIPPSFDSLFQELWDEFAKGSRWSLNADALAVFDHLEKTHIPFVLLTNWDRRVYSVLSDHGILHRFAKVFVSSELGLEKPDPNVYGRVSDTLEIAPERILHVGDSLDHDALGAQNAGFQSAWLDTTQTEAPLSVRKWARLSELTQQVPNRSSTR